MSVSGNTDRRLRARDVFKLIVHANRDGVFARRNLLQLKIVSFACCVAQAAGREDKRPIARIDTILRARRWNSWKRSLESARARLRLPRRQR